MPVLEPGRTVATREPTLRVENAFAPGSYRFRLTVLDEARNESAPVELTICVQRLVIDTGVVRPDLGTVLTPVLRPGIPR
jgi:hypothetical protein